MFVCAWGGGGVVREGLCLCCKIHGGGGGRIMSTYTNLSRGGCSGDIVLH